ncbi:MFS transporter [Rothia uropygialis]|uniref:MFS transporter n=1 Tax=Kocuria sp. 36 TaxID=1415402 RepID=UPI00101C48F0|nr:MFS transporter [Kocuria sp. 36]
MVAPTEQSPSLWTMRAGFNTYVLTRTASLWATTMAPVIVAFGVLSTGAGAHGLAVVTMARTVAFIAALPAAGVLADRVDPRLILLVSHAVAAASQIVAGIALWNEAAPLGLLVSLEAINGAANAATLPVFSALLPRLIGSDLLVRANSAIAMVRSVATVAGPIAGSGIMAIAHPAYGFWINSALFAVGAGAALLLPKFNGDQEMASQSTVVQDVGRGWHEFISRPWVWSVVAAFTAVNAVAAGVQGVIGPAIAVSTPAIGTFGWGVLIGAMGTGMLVAGAVLYRAKISRPLVIGLLGAASIAAIPFALILDLHFLALTPLFAIGGIGVEIFTICWMSALQTKIPPEQLGRISTFDALGSYAAIPIGTAAAGLLTGQNTNVVLTIAGFMVLISSLLPLTLKNVRNLES